MFTAFIVQPIFNLLVLIYALLPGHNFGLALIIFTIVIRLLLWPVLKKQLHHAKAMRQLQPEIKRIKKEAKGNRQMESKLLMELYKERGINPFSTLPILILQLIILIGLYSGLQKLLHDPHTLVNFAYSPLRDLSWMQAIAQDIHRFDNTLLGAVDLGRAAISKGGGIYWPAMLIVAGSAVAQYYQSKQLLPEDKDKRSLRAILKEASEGKQAEQMEVNAAIGRSMIYLLPFMVFIFTVGLPSALSLYWLVGGVVAYIQQSRVLNQDESEMEALADQPTKDVAKIPEAPVVKSSQKRSSKSKKSSNAARKAAKRRKR